MKNVQESPVVKGRKLAPVIVSSYRRGGVQDLKMSRSKDSCDVRSPSVKSPSLTLVLSSRKTRRAPGVAFAMRPRSTRPIEPCDERRPCGIDRSPSHDIRPKVGVFRRAIESRTENSRHGHSGIGASRAGPVFIFRAAIPSARYARNVSKSGDWTRSTGGNWTLAERR